MALKGILLILASLLAALIATPDLFRKYSMLTEAHLGKPAPFTVRAEREYLILDKEATEVRRKEAEESVPPVFNFYVYLAREQKRRVQEAFKLLWSAQVDWLIGYDAELEAKKHAKLPKVKTPLDASTLRYLLARDSERRQHFAELRAKLVEHLRKNDRQAFERLCSELHKVRNKFNRKLGAVLPEDSFEELVRTGVRKQLQEYLTKALQHLGSYAIATAQDGVILSSTRKLTVFRFVARTQYIEQTWSAPFEKVVLQQRLPELLALFAKEAGSKLSALELNLAHRIVELVVLPTFVYNAAETARRRMEARNAVAPVYISVPKGEVVVRAGEKINLRHLKILHGMAEQERRRPAWIKFVSLALLFFLLISALHIYGVRNVRKYALSDKDYLFLFLDFVLVLGLVWAASAAGGYLNEKFPSMPPQVFYYLMPVYAGVMVVRIVLNAESAYLFAVAASLAAGLGYDGSLITAFFVFIVSLVAADGAAPLNSHLTLLYAGARAGVVGAVLAFVHALGMAEPFSVQSALFASAGLVGGIFSALAVALVVPLFEGIFGYTTDLKLLNLIDLNHPLLKDLLVQAPGTHHHSMVVSRLAEEAARKVKARPLLCKAGALYHDIGKIKTPLYFPENVQDGTDYHKNLTPSMSVRILAAHVSEGVQLAETAGLGKSVIDIIAQHHGTSLMVKFYEKAKHLAEEEGRDPQEVDKDSFRYPGPLPQTREAAVVMLADAVETAVRNLAQPSPERLRSTIARVVQQLAADGQLAACDLSIRDLDILVSTFAKVLELQVKTVPMTTGQKKSARRTGQYESTRKQTD